MQSMSSKDFARVNLSGDTMGTRWHVQCWLPDGVDTAPLTASLQSAVDEVDAQMSLWKPDSTLCRLNALQPGQWMPLEPEITRVLACALDVGRMSHGAFDIAVGDAVQAWGFGPRPADASAMTALLSTPPCRALDVLELDVSGQRARKHAPARFDLNGIAKGFGVDRMIEVAADHGVHDLVAALDGDLRVAGTRPDGSLWPVAIEAPDYDRRSAHSLLELSDIAVATSGDYRHWVEVGGQRLSHTINPRTNGPLIAPPASVTVLGRTGMEADAWATALMVLGQEAGTAVARAHGIQAMYLTRTQDSKAQAIKAF